MKLKLIQVGKTDEKYLNDGIEKYMDRLKHYQKIDIITIPDIKNSKNLSHLEQKNKEGLEILKHIGNELLILLDENGKEFNSVQFSDFLQKK